MDTKTAVVYARVSSLGERQDTGRQIADLEGFARSQSLTVLATFEEHISGAKRNEERRGLSECLAFCEQHRPNLLLLSELSRLGRNTLQVLKSLERLHNVGVGVYIQNLGHYSLLPDGKVNPVASILITVLAEMGNIERQNIAYRLNSGRQNYVRRGGKLGRRKGYRKPAEDYLEEYKEVFQLLKKNYSIRNIAKITGVSPSTIQRLKQKIS